MPGAPSQVAGHVAPQRCGGHRTGPIFCKMFLVCLAAHQGARAGLDIAIGSIPQHFIILHDGGDKLAWHTLCGHDPFHCGAAKNHTCLDSLSKSDFHLYWTLAPQPAAMPICSKALVRQVDMGPPRVDRITSSRFQWLRMVR